MVDTGGKQRHPGATERLMAYWAEGTGAAKIRWTAPGAYERCIVLIQHAVTDGGKAPLPHREIHGLCSNLGLRATGTRLGSKGYNKAHGHHYTGDHG